MAREEYSSAILSSVKPEDAVELMKERLARGTGLSEEIADWVRERARIEDRYAQDLKKLADRPLPPASGTMGTLVPAWKSVLKTVIDSSNASSQLSQKLHSNVEAPLRKFGRSHTVEDMRIAQDGLTQLAVDLHKSEDHHHKVTTGKKKGSQQDIEQAQLQVAQNQSQWENQAVYAFEQFETVDHSRLVLLKDVLSRLESSEIERYQSLVGSCEQAMNNVLSFEPNEEIKTFAAHVVSGEAHIMGITGPQQQHQHHLLHHNQARPVNSRTSTSTSDDLYERPRPAGNDDVSIHSSSTKESRVKLRSKVGSIFRGGRKKDKEKHQQKPQIEPISEQESTPWPGSAQARAATAVAPPPPPPHRQSSMPPPPPPQPRKANGIVSSGSSKDDLPSSGAKPAEVDSEGFTIPKTTGTGYDKVGSQEHTEPAVKVNIRQDTITEEGTGGEAQETNNDDDVALSTVASKLRARPTVSGRSNRGRRDIQSRLFTNIESSDMEQQSSDQLQQSPTTMRPPSQQFMSQLQQFPSANSPTSPTSQSSSTAAALPPLPPPPASATAPAAAAAVTATATGNSSHSATPQESTSPVSTRQGSQSEVSSIPQQPQPPQPPFAAGAGGAASQHSETQSLRSLQSNSSSAVSNAVKHGELPTDTALAATNVEILNVQLLDGNVVKAAGIGEVALGYSGESTDQIDIKLENTGTVARVVPNNSIMTGAGDDKYRINTVGAITNVKTGLVALKYVLKDVTVPIVFTPIWRLEQKQASLMMTYKLHESITTPVTIDELVISAPVEGGEATSAQSKPTASFNKDRQRITWRFNEPQQLRPGVEEKLLCRFMTNSQVKESSSGIDVKFKVTQLPQSIQLKYCKEDPFEESDSDWRPVSITRTVTTARYTASSQNNVQIV